MPRGRIEVYLFLTLELEECGVSTLGSGRFIHGKETQYPLYSRVGGTQGQTGRVRKISAPSEFDPKTAQPLASSYID